MDLFVQIFCIKQLIEKHGRKSQMAILTLLKLTQTIEQKHALSHSLIAQILNLWNL